MRMKAPPPPPSLLVSDGAIGGKGFEDGVGPLSQDG